MKDIQNDYISNNGFHALIIYKGELAGIIGYQGISWSRKSTTIGYWIGEAFQGKGIMSKALKQFIDYAFHDLCLNKIEIKVAEENYRSRALPQRFGFKEEGIIRDAEWLDNGFVNHVLYGILRDEWINSNKR
jgi:ribosomal-protein-serine acetyltransferase